MKGASSIRLFTVYKTFISVVFVLSAPPTSEKGLGVKWASTQNIQIRSQANFKPASAVHPCMHCTFIPLILKTGNRTISSTNCTILSWRGHITFSQSISSLQHIDIFFTISRTSLPNQQQSVLVCYLVLVTYMLQRLRRRVCVSISCSYSCFAWLS